MSRALKQADERELSKLYEAEFNKPDLHDRVLIFDVVASWPSGLNVPNVEENERNENGASNQSEDGSDGETAEIENVEMGVNTNDGSEAKSQDCEIASKYADGNKQIENKSSNESEEDDIETANNENETTLTDKEESIEIQETNETEVTNEHETALNDVKINQNTSNGNKTKGQPESDITNDDNDATPSLNDKEQSENNSEILSESNEAMCYHSSERQIIRQHKFYIHSTWLAVQSSYFRSLFFSGMKESSAQEVHVQISGSEEQAHLMLLEAMYKIDTLDNASVDELLEVLKIAHKYDVKFVFKKSKYCLQAAVVSLEICEKIMCFIKIDNTITDVEDLASTLQSFLAKEFSPLDKTWHTTSFRTLCKPSVRYLLSSDELVAVSENTIFLALMFWIKYHGIENVSNSQELPSLLSVVRFELIPIDYLYNNVQHNYVAKKLADFNNHYLRGISYHALSDTMKQRLPCQPVKRKASTESFIPYTWVIPRDKLDNLVGTDQELMSNVFWYCGYRMFLGIFDVVKVKDLRGNQAMFTATLCLGIDNLTQQSEVTIQWQPASQSFTSTPAEQKYTYVKKQYMPSVEIRYKMEVEQEKSSSNEASRLSPMPNSGINFGSPSTNTSGFGTTSSGLYSGAAQSSTTSSGLYSGAAQSSTTSSGLYSGAAQSSTTSSGLYSGAAQSSTTSFFSGATPASTISTGLFSAVTPPRTTSSGFFSGATSPSTNTMGASKPASVLKQESPIPCLSIDVKMRSL